MLFFESEDAFLKVLTSFEDVVGEKVEDTNHNGPIGDEWGVNFVNVGVNESFRKFVSQHYTIVNKYYVKAREDVKEANKA